MDNDKTLQSYNDHIDEYVTSTPQQIDGEFKEWIERVLSKIPKGSTILELGTSFGRDADYMESKGFKVIRTDAAQGFVDLLKNQGHDAHLLNALKDDFGSELDMIFANAVLLHFEPEEVNAVIQKAYDSLKQNGFFVFSLKEGDGAEWSEAKLNSPRYFIYWSETDLRDVLSGFDFRDIELSKRDSGRDKWLQVIAKK